MHRSGMKPHRASPGERPSTIVVTVIAVIALLAVAAIGLYIVANLNEVVGFSSCLRLSYGGWG
jgi:hypothetical protein